MSETIQTLSEHLLSLSTAEEYAAATHHQPFLEQAAIGVLPPARLAQWLAQVRVYATHAYPRFIGALIASIPFSAHDVVSSPRERRNAEILRVLVSGLDITLREIGFFDSVEDEWEMNIDAWNQRNATRDYTAEMSRIAAQGSLEEGIVFLWAMEKIRLDSWNHFINLQDAINNVEVREFGLAVTVRCFANSWTSRQSVEFVDALQALVNNLNISPGDELYFRVENTWKRAVELEVEFWPHDGEDLAGN